MEKCVLSGPERQLLIATICGRLRPYSTFAQIIMHVRTHIHEPEERNPSKGFQAEGAGAVIILEPLPSRPIVWSLSLAALECPSSRLTVASFSYGNAHGSTRDGLALIGFDGTQQRRGQPIGSIASLSLVCLMMLTQTETCA